MSRLKGDDNASVGIRNMAVRTINNAIRRIDWDEMKSSLLPEDENVDSAPVQVCTASLDNWNCYVISEEQLFKSKYMKSVVWIVEFPGTLHGAMSENFSIAMLLATGTGDTHLNFHGDSHTNQLPRGLENEVLTEPDRSYGPAPNIGAVLPPQLRRWSEYSTLKVEIKVAERWVDLDRKSAIWRKYPGVEYVVSIKLSPGLQIRQHRLEQRVNRNFPDDPNRAEILEIDQNPILEFDAHSLLGLPVNSNPPLGFNNLLTIDLLERVESVRLMWEVQPEGGSG